VLRLCALFYRFRDAFRSCSLVKYCYGGLVAPLHIALPNLQCSKNEGADNRDRGNSFKEDRGFIVVLDRLGSRIADDLWWSLVCIDATKPRAMHPNVMSSPPRGTWVSKETEMLRSDRDRRGIVVERVAGSFAESHGRCLIAFSRTIVFDRV
jgi:hypothetical protein